MSALTPADIGKIKDAALALERLGSISLPDQIVSPLLQTHDLLVGFVLGLEAERKAAPPRDIPIQSDTQREATIYTTSPASVPEPGPVLAKSALASADAGMQGRCELIPAPITADMPDLPPFLDRRGK